MRSAVGLSATATVFSSATQMCAPDRRRKMSIDHRRACFTVFSLLYNAVSTTLFSKNTSRGLLRTQYSHCIQQ